MGTAILTENVTLIIIIVNVTLDIPFMVLSDGDVANVADAWKITKFSELSDIKLNIATNSDSFQPYKHNEETLAREWAVPGMKNFEHRVGGLEKANVTGNVSYDPDNHHYMVEHRQKKVDIISNYIYYNH